VAKGAKGTRLREVGQWCWGRDQGRPVRLAPMGSLTVHSWQEDAQAERLVMSRRGLTPRKLEHMIYSVPERRSADR
jgi:hypothetical protein